MIENQSMKMSGSILQDMTKIRKARKTIWCSRFKYAKLVCDVHIRC